MNATSTCKYAFLANTEYVKGKPLMNESTCLRMKASEGQEKCDEQSQKSRTEQILFSGLLETR